MPPLVIAGLALAAAKVIKGFSDKSKANKIKAQFTPYESSPYAAQQLATAHLMMNGRMEGATSMERNIDKEQAGYKNFIDKNAVSGSQALALASGSESQVNGEYADLQTREQQNKYGLLSNLNQAYQTMTNENDKVWQSKNQKYMMDTNQKRALNESGDQNIFGGISDGISMGMMGSGTSAAAGGSAAKGNYAGGFQPQGIGRQSSFAGPANTFGAPPAYNKMQLWYPVMQKN